MPNPNTFEIAPIAAFIERWRRGVVADPFARNSRIADYTNDLSPDTMATDHMEAEAWFVDLARRGVKVDTLLFDPPYSPRQVSEVYQSVGRDVGMKETQSGALYRRVRDAAMGVLAQDAVALSFGWNSAGMGIGRGFEIAEILIVAHGGAHNDTICVAERRTQCTLELGDAA